MKYFSNFIIILLCLFNLNLANNTTNGKKLILVQVIFRHGERAPLLTYPNDPYKDYDWGVPLGNLTKHGIQQQVELGANLRERYMIKKQFLSKKYRSNEIIARSTKRNRTIESAQANLRGFYQLENISHIPIITTFFQIPKPWEGGRSCPKYVNLITSKKASYEDTFYNNNKEFIEFLKNVTGIQRMLMSDVADLYDTLEVQKLLKCKLPRFLKKRQYYKLKHLVKQIYRLQDGLPAFNFPEDILLMRLNEGPLLKNIIDNFDLKLKIYKKPKSVGGLNYKYLHPKLEEKTKYVSYSAHDYTIANIFALMGLKKFRNKKSLRINFTATLFFELYENSKGKHEIKILFSREGGKKILDITDRVLGCKKSKTCLFEDFKEGLKDRIPRNVYTECFVNSVVKN
uniref:2-phosphoxylose phosphatase 1 n=1 Tax=Strongyloides papillosus TaxID=174720 RepID=A0A0N5CI36_STREA